MSLDLFVNEFEKRFCVIYTVSIFKHFLKYKILLKLLAEVHKYIFWNRLLNTIK